MSYRIEEKSFPSGIVYGDFYMGRILIGRAIFADGNWLLPNARKALPADDAAKAFLRRTIRQARNNDRQARQFLDVLSGDAKLILKKGGTP